MRSLGVSLAALLCLAAPAAANVYSGSLSDDTTGPIPAGVHMVVNHIAVQAGKTLTVQAGAVLKFTGGYWLDIYGQLLVQGASGSEVIFTSYPDDSAGGDTNGNGPSSGSPGQWCGIFLEAASGPNLFDHARVRYAGYAGYDAVRIHGAGVALTMTDSVLEMSSADGLDLLNHLNYPTVSNCQFNNNAGRAVEGLCIDAVPGFTDNSASGNGGSYMNVTNPNVQGTALTIEAQNCLNGALVFPAHCAIASGKSLTLKERVVVKVWGGYWLNVHGSLNLLGTAADPVVITSYHDDAWAGDTNNNGASSGSPGQWCGIILEAASGPNLFDHARVRYAGYAGYDAVGINGAGVGLTMTDSVLESSSTDGLDLRSYLNYPTVSDCQFNDNAGRAVEGLCIDAVPGFTDNSASGNGGSYMNVTNPNVQGTALTIEAQDCLNGALVFPAHCAIASGKSLTLKERVVVKVRGGYWLNVHGSLNLLGTAADPVVITSYHDDDWAGDTNNNGASSGSPGQWCGIILEGGSGPNALDHAVVRYAGYAGWDPVRVHGAAVGLTLTDTILERSSTDGLELGGNPCYPVVTNCQFLNNAGRAVEGLCIDSAPGFADNAASGNGGNYMNVIVPSPAADVTVEARNCLNGVLVFPTHCTVQSGRSLTLDEGITIKVTGGYYIWLYGALNVAGTPRNPVVFTSTHDDAYAGDTNNNGAATAGSPGQWCGLVYSATTATSTVENLLVRFAGYAGYAGFDSGSALLDARRVRVEYANNRGFSATNLLHGEDWVAYACGTTGVELKGGSFALRRVTAAGNSGAGIAKNGAWIGTLSSAISWGNAGGNYSGITQGHLYYSNGSATLAGLDGNINQDPLFLDLAGGNLALAYGTPCADAGDPADHAFSTQGMDLVSRELDGDLDGIVEIDMGAYEYTNVRLAVTGTFTPGGTMTFTSTGKPGLASFMLLAMAEGDFDLYPYGTIYLDLLGPWTFLGWAQTESQITLPVPLGLPVPLPVSFQQLAVNGAGGPGNFSNPVSIVVQ